MREIHHPSKYINDRHVAAIRSSAAEAERLGMLNEGQLTIAYNQKWFRLLVPEVYGGRQIALPDLVRLQEAISWTDGSAGWVVTLCSGAGWFGGFIDTDAAKEIFNTENVCLAGSGAISGTAEIVENGYLLNGSWNYASGAHHATHFTANCAIKRSGEAVLNDDGLPLVLPFVIDKDDVTLLPTWKYMGMVATGSHSFKLDNVQVPASRCFHIDARYSQIEEKLYQYPFLQLAEATLAVNLSGMVMHFVDLCRDIFEEKQNQAKLTTTQKDVLLQTLDEQTDLLNLARTELFASVDASWGKTTQETLREVSHTSRVLARLARVAVDTLYPYCGLKAAAPDTEINRVWRDLHTAGQHSLLTFLEVADN
jgi:alkylation response protein AidB-like acyl-CoA dehydrogenase